MQNKTKTLFNKNQVKNFFNLTGDSEEIENFIEDVNSLIFYKIINQKLDEMEQENRNEFEQAIVDGNFEMIESLLREFDDYDFILNELVKLKEKIHQNNEN
jgi:hypothetical protein